VFSKIIELSVKDGLDGLRREALVELRLTKSSSEDDGVRPGDGERVGDRGGWPALDVGEGNAAADDAVLAKWLVAGDLGGVLVAISKQSAAGPAVNTICVCHFQKYLIIFENFPLVFCLVQPFV